MNDLLDNEEFFELKNNFASQVLQRIGELEGLILKIEEENDESKLKEISRQLLAEFHSIKGSSGAFHFECSKVICHKVEDIIQTEGTIGLKNRVDLLLLYCDTISHYFNLFIKLKNIDEKKFIDDHKNIFENLLIVKAPGHDVNKNLQLLNVLVVGLPNTLLKNLNKSISHHYELKLSFATTSIEAIEKISKDNFHLVLSSYFIEPINGVALCASLKCQRLENSWKFILFPSQNVELGDLKNKPNLLPDKIILKDQEMYRHFSDYLVETFKVNRKYNRVAFLDDDQGILDLYKMMFDNLGVIEKKYINPSLEWENELKSFAPDLVVSDVNMPNVNIFDFLKNIKTHSENPDVVFVTGDTELPICQKIKNAGIVALCDKSDISNELTSLLTRLIAS